MVGGPGIRPECERRAGLDHRLRAPDRGRGSLRRPAETQSSNVLDICGAGEPLMSRKQGACSCWSCCWDQPRSERTEPDSDKRSCDHRVHLDPLRENLKPPPVLLRALDFLLLSVQNISEIHRSVLLVPFRPMTLPDLSA